MNKDKKAWEQFKFVIFISGVISFLLGAIVVIFPEWFPVTLFGILFHPIVVFEVWKRKSELFLKKGIKK